jgi:(p)ppGpp synthase/HD superfamily hydrolase
MAFPVLSSSFIVALEYAAIVHNGQPKKKTSIPYISHLLAVCALVLENGGKEKVAIAALLHDTLEDHPKKVSRKELRRIFGDKVGAIVEGCTDTPANYRGGKKKSSWRERKTKYIKRLRHESPAVCLVALADKLHNVRAILADYKEIGDKLWPRFNAGKKKQLWFFGELVKVFQKKRVPTRMLREFEQVVAELECLARTP